MKEKAMSVVPKKKIITSFQEKKNKEILKDACNKNKKNKKSKRFQPIRGCYIKILF
jgi:hypothetical protein